MAIAIAKIKIMPSSPQADLKKIKEDAIKVIEKTGAKLHSSEEQEIAFGLKALILTITLEEEEGTDKMENALSKISNVNSVQVIDFRRAIG